MQEQREGTKNEVEDLQFNPCSAAFVQCSVTCGQGQRQREVQCRYEDGTTSNQCNRGKKPESIMDCVLEDCPTWREEPWGEVSTNIRDIAMTSFELCLHVVT